MTAAESMRFICNGCGYRARIPTSYTGKVILCPGCQQMQIASADGGDPTGDTVRMSRVATAPGTGRFSIPDADGRLRFTCSGCGYSAKLASNYAGKAISCPKCQSPQVIPPLQGPEDNAGKPRPSSTPESATAPTVDAGLTFDDEPAVPPARAPVALHDQAAPAADAPQDDEHLTFGDEPSADVPSGARAATSLGREKPSVSAVKPPAKPSTKPGSGGVVRRGGKSQSASRPIEEEEEVANEEDGPVPPSRPLPPFAQKLKEPRMMALIGGGVAALILLIVLISGWSSAAGEAEKNRIRAEASESRANDLATKKAEVEFNLSKATEDIKRLKQTESEAKAALAASETRLAELSEQLKKAEAVKSEEYALRKKAEAAHDEMFAKLQETEKKRNEDYRASTELRRKYEEEVKLRKDLQARLTEAQAAAK